MNLRRKIYDKMMQWKDEKKRHKALIIEGMRQIGKSYIVEKFAKEQYKKRIFFDFRSNVSHRDIFKGDFDLKTFKTNIVVLTGEEYDDSDAVLVFDEIGDSPDARAAIKYLIKETNFDIIATGSLLGVKGFSSRGKRSASVGFEEFVTMYPLDFEEFLWANGISEDVINEVNSCLDDYHPIIEFIHNKLDDLFSSYVVVGGMPEAVIIYLETLDYYKCYEKNTFLLREMESDFGRTLDENGDIIFDSKLLARTKEVFNSLPSQLAKDNTKFQFSQIRKGARAKEYEEAIVWLIDSGMVKKCCNLTDIDNPLSMYAINDSYKLYFCDTGLLLAKIGFSAITGFVQKKLASAGGFFYENIASSELVKENYELFYSDNGVSELDFIVETIDGPAIIEVKQGNKQSKSARAVIEGKSNRHASICYKVRSGNFGIGSYYYGLPHYAFSFLLNKIKSKLVNLGGNNESK